MQSKEMTETDQQTLRDGLRILARLIARHHVEATKEQEADLPSAVQRNGAARS